MMYLPFSRELFTWPLGRDAQGRQFRGDVQVDGPNTSDAYTDKVWLSDGGAYDNLGLETVWSNIVLTARSVVSDISIVEIENRIVTTQAEVIDSVTVDSSVDAIVALRLREASLFERTRWASRR